MGWWRQPDSRSEYEGGGVQDNTIFPKDPEALNSNDKLRLQSLTGQEEDSRAPRDPYHWLGGTAPEEIEPGPTEQQILDEADPY